MRKLTVKLVEEQIIETRGNVSMIAARLRRTRYTIYKFLEKNPQLRETLDDARETMIDNVESNLYKKALEGDVACMIFFLKTQGRKRGYGDEVLNTNVVVHNFNLQNLDGAELTELERLTIKAQADEQIS